MFLFISFTSSGNSKAGHAQSLRVFGTISLLFSPFPPNMEYLAEMSDTALNAHRALAAVESF